MIWWVVIWHANNGFSARIAGEQRATRGTEDVLNIVVNTEQRSRKSLLLEFIMLQGFRSFRKVGWRLFFFFIEKKAISTSIEMARLVQNPVH